MTATVGIPRALLYYYYYPQWITFFHQLEVKTVVSRPTNRGILEKGLQATVDEACLPVKLAVGHVLDLRERVDFIFLPRLVSTAHKEYICPKFLGFPDMVRHTVSGLPPLIDCNLNLYRRNSSSYEFFREVGKMFTWNPVRLYSAYREAMRALERHRREMEAGRLPGEWGGGRPEEEDSGDVTVAVIGHPYNIYDRFVNMNLLGKLRENGAIVLTVDRVPEEIVCREAQKLPKRLFWTLNRRMVGAAFHYLARPDVHGIVHVVSFGCGPDSITGELIERYARQRWHKPLLNLNIDEHTGEAGVVTRLEAFLDMVRWRRSLACAVTAAGLDGSSSGAGDDLALPHARQPTITCRGC